MALFAENSRTSLKKDDINKKSMHSVYYLGTRLLNTVLSYGASHTYVQSGLRRGPAHSAYHVWS